MGCVLGGCFGFVGVLFYQVLVSRAQTVRKSISSGEVVDFSPLSQKIEYKYLTDSDYLFAASGYGAVLKDATDRGENFFESWR